MHPNFELIFDKYAETFANNASNFISWKYIGIPILDKYLISDKDTKILDIGCGSGRVIEYLVNKGVNSKNITGVEISQEQIKISKSKYPDVNYIHSDIIKTMLPENYFDFAISNMVLEYLDDNDLKKSFKIILDSLKPKSKLILITTHPLKMKQMYGLKNEGWFEVKYDWGNYGYDYYREVNTIIDIIKNIGGNIDVIEELGIPENAKHDDIKRYNNYKKYDKIRLVIVFSK